MDDADLASPQVLAQVARLAQYDPSPDARLTIVLAGRQEQIGRIGDRLLGLADLRIDIEPWEQAETENYLKASLAQAGCRAAVFAEPALARLQELSHGIPAADQPVGRLGPVGRRGPGTAADRPRGGRVGLSRVGRRRRGVIRRHRTGTLAAARTATYAVAFVLRRLRCLPLPSCAVTGATPHAHVHPARE